MDHGKAKRVLGLVGVAACSFMMGRMFEFLKDNVMIVAVDCTPDNDDSEEKAQNETETESSDEKPEPFGDESVDE